MDFSYDIINAWLSEIRFWFNITNLWEYLIYMEKFW